jgi:tetratricopeptide (TPR) repeat protein
MKAKLAQGLRTVLLFVCAMAVFSATFAAVPASQDKQQAKDGGPKISEGEQQAIGKINAASGLAEKLKASAEYLKKYGKSPHRPRVAGYVADEVWKVTDSAQRLSLIENFTKTFNQPNEADLVKPALIDAQLNAGRVDDAINEAAKYLERNPEEVTVLTQLAWAGANQVQRQAQSGQAVNPEQLQKAAQAGAKAAEMLEQDKKPERMDAAYWNNYRNSWLPRLYQAQGVMAYFSNDKAAAKEKLEKAIGLDPYDPPALLMITNILNDEYNQIAQKYQTEKKQALLNEAMQKMDELIDYLARTAAATEGNAQYQAINGPIMENLKSYYAFRHEGKVDGLKELIQKYKKP